MDMQTAGAEPSLTISAPARIAAALVVVGALLTGCGESSGPALVADGTYRLYAAASTPTADQRGAAMLQIAGDEVELTDREFTATRVFNGVADEVLVCPPSGRGSPQLLGAPLAVDGVQFIRPALFGDCGLTTPVRGTLVDLDSVDGTRQFPFARWAEFCDVTDPDC
jgi:hypothetical protein